MKSMRFAAPCGQERSIGRRLSAFAQVTNSIVMRRMCTSAKTITRNRTGSCRITRTIQNERLGADVHILLLLFTKS